MLKVGAVEEDRSVKETAEEKAKRKAKEKKVGEARSAMSKEGLTLPVVQPKGRTLCGERARRRCPARTWLSARPLPPPKAKG